MARIEVILPLVAWIGTQGLVSSAQIRRRAELYASLETETVDPNEIIDFLRYRKLIQKVGQRQLDLFERELTGEQGEGFDLWEVTGKTEILLDGAEKARRETKNHDPKDLSGLFEREVQRAKQRIGQTAFRDELIDLYECKCMISLYDAKEALEAAHIKPYKDFRCRAANKRENGLLLRADLHALFDQLLIAIEPNLLEVKIGKPLLQTTYSGFCGKVIKPHSDVIKAKLANNLTLHFEKCEAKNGKF